MCVFVLIIHDVVSTHVMKCKWFFFGSATAPCVGRYAFRPVSSTETVPEASSEDEMTEKILLGKCKYCAI